MGGRLPIDLPIENNNIAIVLVRPKYDGNIGAVARTVLNFGITDSVSYTHLTLPTNREE